jgi:acyl transferase domain-containing protein/acyl carrier protein/SAM-dependent methyltransferase
MTASFPTISSPLADAYGESQPIAVIGAACRFPGSDTIEGFWRNIADGIDLVTEVNADMLRQAGLSPALLQRKDFVPVASIVENADRFDAAFFGYSPQEAASIDPQQRIFLTLAWEALDSAGYGQTSGARNIGVFGAARMSTYQLPARDNLIEAGAPRIFQRLIGNDKDYLATRVAFKLGLTGPALVVQTACSSSLVAVHMACEHIRNGECEMALAGGVGISFPQETGTIHHEGMIFSRDGRCRPYDASAQGTRIGNGAGLVLLKPLAEALADGDPVLAVIRGSAVNNDGAGKIGFTAPSVEGQAAVIREALGMAEVDAGSIGLVEGHGTATPLGDPIEVEALARAYRDHTDRRQYCALGSVKSNIGHADTAAGIASLLKAIMALRHGQIPPNLHFERPNPENDFAASPFYVPQYLKPWLQEAGVPRRAGVSSFGIGGTNCHVVLEAAPSVAEAARPQEGAPTVLALSAHSPEALRRTAARFAADLAHLPDAELPALAETLRRRLQDAHRLAVAGADGCDLADALEAFATNGGKGQPVIAQTTPEGRHKVALLFTGQGSQEPGMGAALYRADAAFRAAYDRCATTAGEMLGVDLPGLMLTASPALCNPINGQAALVCFEYAMAQSWIAAGVVPDAVMGHSLGELAAAAVAGMLTPEDAVRLAIRRAQLVAGLPERGGMAVLRASRETVAALIEASGEDRLAIAADNGPENIAIAGPSASLEQLVARASAEGAGGQVLAMSNGFHSPLLDPVLDEYEAYAATLAFRPGEIALYSTVTAGRLETADASHWRAHLRREVRFAQAMKALHADGFTAFIEVGPAATLYAMGPRCIESAGLWLPSRRHQVDEMLQWRLSEMAAYQGGLIAPRAQAWQDRRAHPTPRALDEQSHWAPIPAIIPAEPETAMPAPAASGGNTDAADAWEAALASAGRIAEAGAGSFDVAKIDREDAAVQVLHSAYVGAALRALGCFGTPDERRTLGDLLRTTPIKPKFRQLLQRMLRDLTEAGALQREGRDYFGLTPAPLDATEPFLRELRERGDHRLAGLIERGGAALADMLASRVDPVSVIFPAGSSDDVEEMYQRSSQSRYFNAVAADAVATYARARGEPLRMLEVGAGTGGTTWDIVHALDRSRVESYTFTDAGPLFLSRAKEKFRDFPYMAYRAFDMEKPPAEQGLSDASFDIIVAANVLHNARDLRDVLTRLHGLLRPGGIVVLREITAHKKLFDFVFGPLVPPLDDMEERGDNLFASVDVWRQAAEAAGFAASEAIPGADMQSARLGEHVLLMRKADNPARQVIAGAGRPARTTTVEAGSPANLLRLLWRGAEQAGLPVRQLRHVVLENLRRRTDVRIHAGASGIALVEAGTGRRLAWAKPVEGLPATNSVLVDEPPIGHAHGDGIDALLAAFDMQAPGFHIREIGRMQGEAAQLRRVEDGFAVINTRGKPILLCQGISVRRSADEPPWADEVEAHLYMTTWHETAAEPPARMPGKVVLIGAASRELASSSTQIIATAKDDIAAAVARAFAEGAPLVFAASPPISDHGLADIQRPVAQLVAILRDIRTQAAGRQLQFSVLTSGAASATLLDEIAHPAMASLAGFLRVAASEFPEITFQLLDIDDEAGRDSAILRRIAGGEPGHFALRGGRWFEERLERAPRPSDAAEAMIAGDGLCILIGGLSEMGLTLAHWLADHGASRIAFIGRGGAAVDEDAVLAALRERNVTVLTAFADAGDADSLQQALEEVVKEGVAVAAIFHLAGVVEDAPIIAHDEESFARVLRPKWLGAMTCHRLEAELRPGLTVYFSSATTVFGPTGQAAHATANAALEGLARHRSARGMRTVAIAWGFWADIRRREREDMARRLAEGGMLGLPTPMALALLERAMSCRAPVLAAFKADWEKIGAAARGRGVQPHLRGFVEQAQPQPNDAGAAHGDDPLQAVLIAQAGERDAALRRYLRSRLADLLQRAPGDIAEDINLIRLGLDSLMFLEFSQRLTSELGISVTADIAFSLDTVAKLAAHIDAEMPEAETSGVDAIRRGPSAGRTERIADYLRGRVATLLGMAADRVSPDENLIRLGLDSLMFLELSHTISTELGVTVTAEAAFDHSTIAALANHIAGMMEAEAGLSRQEAPRPGHATRAALKVAAAQGRARIDANGDLAPLAPEDRQSTPQGDHAAALRAARWQNSFSRIVEPRLYAEWDKRHFDLPRFEQVWNRLIARHDMLRAADDDAGGFIVLRETPPYPIAMDDLSGMPHADREARLAEIRMAMRTAAIDAARWPRFALRASRLSAETMRLHMDLDTRLADVESFQILLREIAVLMANPEAVLPALDLSPCDYVSALAAVQEDDVLAEMRQAWLRALSTRPAFPSLPMATPPTPASAATLTSVQCILQPDRWGAIKTLTRQHGLTSTALVCAIYAAALGARASTGGFAIDLHYFNRLPLHAQVKNVVGDFSAAMPVSFDDGAAQGGILELAQAAQQQIAALRAAGDLSAFNVQRHGIGLAQQPAVAFTTFLGIDADYPLTETEDPVLGLPIFEQTGLPGAALHLQALEHDVGLILTLTAHEGFFAQGLVEEFADDIAAGLVRLAEEVGGEPADASEGDGEGQQHRRRSA